MTAYVGALDQGTSSTRFAVFDERGMPVVIRQAEHRQHLPGPGLVEHDADEIWLRSCQVISEALDAVGLTGSDLCGVGVTNQRETAVAWDRRTGRVHGKAIVWQDTRTAPRMQQLADGELGPMIRNRTGLTPSAYFTAGKYAWLLEHNSELRTAVERGDAMLGTVDSWLVWNLTGGVHVTDVTNASRTMLMNLDTLQWDSDLLDIFGIPISALPRIVPSADRTAIGRSAPHTPLGSGVPIAAVLGDQHAAMVGQVCFEPGDVKTTYGTGNFILVNTGRDIVRTDQGLLTTVAYQFGSQEPVYALEGAVGYTGSTIQWLRDEIGVLSAARDSERLASEVDDNGGVYLVPAFSGLFSPHWRPDARGTIVGLSRHSTGAHLVRAALESICFQTHDVLEVMKTACRHPLARMKVDGGVSENELCMQMQADLSGIPLLRPTVAETTALGAAYAAGLAVGMWPNAAALQRIWTSVAEWSPRWTSRQQANALGQWRKAVERSLDWMDLDSDHANGAVGPNN